MLPGGLCRTCQNGYRKVGEQCVKVSCELRSMVV